MNWIARTAAGWKEASRRRRDAVLLSQMPDRLLYDIGLTPDSARALAHGLGTSRR